MNKISLTQKFSDADIIALGSAGRLIGTREAKFAALYLTTEGVVAAIDKGSMPHYFSVLLATVRWSVTRSEYVISANELLDDATRLMVRMSIGGGLAFGRETYDATANESAE